MIDARDIKDHVMVKCRRPDLGTNAAMLLIRPDSLEIVYGNPSMLGGITEVEKEVIRVAEHPEIKGIYGPLGWDVTEIAALISH